MNDVELTTSGASWVNVDLSNVNPGFETIPPGEYTFAVVGAKWGASDPNRIEASATIVTEGDFTGRRIFFSYPDPEKYSSKGKKMDWSIQVFKRLETALGVEKEAGQSPVEYLNAVAGHRFNGTVKLGQVTEAYPTPKAELDIFNPRPAV